MIVLFFHHCETSFMLYTVVDQKVDNKSSMVVSASFFSLLRFGFDNNYVAISSSFLMCFFVSQNLSCVPDILILIFSL